MSNMMSGFGRIMSYAFNSLDMTSAANDVIVVRHRDGTLKSSPFNVRFGKVKVLRPQDKIVCVEINGQLTNAVMKMGSEGEAFWLEPVEGSVPSFGRPESPVETMLIKSPNTMRAVPSPALSAVGGGIAPPSHMDVTLPPATVAATVQNNSVASSRSSATTENASITTPAAGPSTGSVGAVDNLLSPPLAPLPPPNTPSAPENKYADPMAMTSPPLAPAAVDPTAFFSEGLTAKEMAPYGALLRSFASTGMMPEVDEDGNLVVAPGSEPTPVTAALCASLLAASADRGVAGFAVSPSTAVATDVGTSPLVMCASTSHHPSDVVTLSAALLSTTDPSGATGVQHQHHHHHHKHTRTASTSILAVVDSVATPSFAPTHPTVAVSLSVEQQDGVKQQQQTAASGTPSEEAGGAFEYAEEEEEFEEGSESDMSAVSDDDETVNSNTSQPHMFMSPGLGPTTSSSSLYFRPTLTPIAADLEKLNLKEGCNRVRYITQTSLRGTVVVDANIYYWPSDAKIVVSDIDGTVTKSDVWGHLLPLIGRDWTHPGICSLFSKVERNGYKFVYLTARSIAQQEKTSQFLWGIEQDGDQLPRGPVLTAPDRFFTALTQEVSKKSHEFKIACLKSVLHAFPKTAKPFYAGFGNRIGDVISYTATQIPKHKIFIIDPNSTLHVCRVKQTYKNLAHMVDVTFPPLKPSNVPMQQVQHLAATGGIGSTISSSTNFLTPSSPFGRTPPSPDTTQQDMFLQHAGTSREGSLSSVDGIQPATRRSQSQSTATTNNNGGQYVISVPLAAPGSPGATTARTSNVTFHPQAMPPTIKVEEEMTVDADFNSFNFWRIQPEELIAQQTAIQKNIANNNNTSTTSNKGTGGGGTMHPSFTNLKPLQVPSTEGSPNTSFEIAEANNNRSNNGTTSEPTSTKSNGTQKSGWSRWWGGGSKNGGGADSATPLSPKDEPQSAPK